MKHALIATVFAGTTLLSGGTALAQPPPQQDGLINVAVGDVTILQDVRVAVGAQVAAAICGLKVGPVVVLGRAVDRSGNDVTVCALPQGQDVVISDN